MVPAQLLALLAASAFSSLITTAMNVTRLFPTQLTANVTSAWFAARHNSYASIVFIQFNYMQ